MGIGNNRNHLGIFLSILLGFILMIQVLVFTKDSSRIAIDMGDFSGLSLSEVEEKFQESPSNENLIFLLKVMYYKSNQEKNQDLSKDLIKKYGNELLLRAKEEKVDLSKVEEEEIMLEIIRFIKDFDGK